METFVTVATYSDEIEAQLAQATLAAAEIESFLKHDDAGGMLESLQFTKGVQLLVDEKNVDEAKTLLSTQASEEIE
jgi:hypothetical protein